MFLSYFDRQFITISSSFHEEDDKILNQRIRVSLVEYEKLIADHMFSTLNKNATESYDSSSQPFYFIEIKNSLAIFDDVIQLKSLRMVDVIYPNINHVEKELTLNPNISLTFYSASGYDFSSELCSVYHLKSTQNTLFHDSLATCQRAMQTCKYYQRGQEHMDNVSTTKSTAVNPHHIIGSSVLQKLAAIVHSISLYEIKICSSIITHLCIQNLPFLTESFVNTYANNLEKSQHNKNSKFNTEKSVDKKIHVSVYFDTIDGSEYTEYDVGNDTQENGLHGTTKEDPNAISFHISIMMPLHEIVPFTAVCATSATSSANSTIGSFVQSGITNKDIFDLSYVCYYRHYQLNVQQLTSSSVSGNNEGSSDHSESDSVQLDDKSPLFTLRSTRAYLRLPNITGSPSNGSDSSSGTREDMSTQSRGGNQASALTEKRSTAGSSTFAELMTWGRNTSSSMGLGAYTQQTEPAAADASTKSNLKMHANKSETQLIGTRPVPLPLHVLLQERVVMLACSHRHSLLLSGTGMVYACGDNSEGALGMDDMFPRHSFMPVIWQQLQSSTNTHSRSTDSDGDNKLLSSQHPFIVKIAAATAVIGSHSAALDRLGRLYTWGVPHATGHGTARLPFLTPTVVDLSMLPATNASTEFNATSRTASNTDESVSSQTTAALRVIDVSCGVCFTVAVLSNGRVASWGVYDSGRLGLGQPAVIKSVGSGRSRPSRPNTLFNRVVGATTDSATAEVDTDTSRNKHLKYSLSPKYVDFAIQGASKSSTAVAVACGEAHTLLLLSSGEVAAWGLNSCGQLGLGPTHSGLLKNAYTPLLIPRFANHSPSSGTLAAVKVKAVYCGSFHSVAVDTSEGVWTWGARGGACLGHADSDLCDGHDSNTTHRDKEDDRHGDNDNSRKSYLLPHFWKAKLAGVFPLHASSSSVTVPYELLGWCRLWSTPRLVRLFQSVSSASVSAVTPGGHSTPTIIHVSAGDMHTALLLSTGQLLLCGSGPVVPPVYSGNGDDYASSVAAVDIADHNKDEETLETMFKTVNIFRQPFATWLPLLITRRVVSVFGGSSRLFVLLAEDIIANSLTQSLFLKTMKRKPQQNSMHELESGDGSIIKGKTSFEMNNDEYDSHLVSEDADDDIDNASAFLTDVEIFKLLDTRGMADCMLVAGGRVLLCHRAVLAARSPELREMIEMESPTPTPENRVQTPVQVLLPELQYLGAKALLHYIYTDTLPRFCLTNISMLQSLLAVSQTLRMPRLQMLCEMHSKLISYKSLFDQEDADADEDLKVKSNETAFESMSVDLLPCTLARDLGHLVGDPTFADVKFIAEGRSVYAHRFVLEQRSDYFKVLFRTRVGRKSGHCTAGVTDAEGAERAVHYSGIIGIAVPDTFIGLLRMLLFLYTNTLPAGVDGVVLEDLMTADRYNLPEMKHLCECMLTPSMSNWLDLLRAGDRLGALRLMVSSLQFLKTNVKDICSEVDTASVPSIYTDAAAVGAAVDEIDVKDVQVQPREENNWIAFQQEYPHLYKRLVRETPYLSRSSESKKDVLSSEATSAVSDLPDERIDTQEIFSAWNRPRPPSSLYIQHIEFTYALKQQQNNSLLNSADVKFPYTAVLASLGSLGVYYFLVKNPMLMNGNLIPVFNFIYMVGFLYYLYHSSTREK